MLLIGGVAMATCAAAAAGQLEVSQHGARGVAQAGAMTAGVDDASAATYNPAALVCLPGAEVQLGIWRDAPRDEYLEPNFFSGRQRKTYTSDHGRTWLPAMYATYTRRRSVRWAVGIGVDAPSWFHGDRPGTYYGVSLRPDLYVTLKQIHTVAAVALNDRWSIGGGIRYLWGRVADQYDMLLDSGRNPGTFFVYGQRSIEASAHDWAADGAVLYRERQWGFGAVAATGATVNGVAKPEEVHALFDGPYMTPRAAANLAYLQNDAPRGVGVDMPPEFRGGLWLRPAPPLRVEADAVLLWWSHAGWRRPREYPTCGPSCSENLPRDWRNAISLRVGIQGDAGRALQLQAGFGYEPSPVRPERQVPNAHSAATTVFGAGLSYNLPRVSFDTAYSLQTGRAQQPEEKGGERFCTRNNVLAVTARFRF